MAEDENTSGFISACGGMSERSADGKAKEIDNDLGSDEGRGSCEIA